MNKPRDLEEYPNKIHIYFDEAPYFYRVRHGHGEGVWISGSEKYFHESEVVKLRNMITRLRRAISSGTTHIHDGITPPLSIEGSALTNEAWNLVPTDKIEGT
jgi:hypothetical protein